VQILQESKTPGLKGGADKEANWLPAPQTGNIRPIMRMYQPQQPIIDGRYLLPAIKRVV